MTPPRIWGGNEARSIILEARVLCRYLIREYGLENVEECLSIVQGNDAIEALHAALANPGNWGMAKSMMMEGTARGFDASSKEGIERWMTAYILTRSAAPFQGSRLNVKLPAVRVLVGTSGYSYAPWKGSFYPEKLPAAKMLAFYATRLPTVEINNTFYRMPAAEMLQRWAAETPDSFSFVLKSPKRITHEKRLLDAGDPAGRFYEIAAALGPKLGPQLFQLPPNLKKDVPRLEAFLTQVRAAAPGARPAFEFRHASWFDDEVYATLRAHQAALCIAEDEELATPFEATAGWGYLRLRRQDYDDAALAAWAERLRARAGAWSEAHVFFKHEDEGKGPKLAASMIALCGQM